MDIFRESLNNLTFNQRAFLIINFSFINIYSMQKVSKWIRDKKKSVKIDASFTFYLYYLKMIVISFFFINI